MSKEDKKKKDFIFWDLFAGVGGFHSAFINYCKKRENINPKCCLVSEIDDNAKKVYTNNFKIHSKEEIKGIYQIEIEKHKKPDIIFAGFPCQPFSNAGKKKGFVDSRGRMIDRVVEILKKTKPSYAVLENVAFIANHNDGKTWKSIVQKITDIGYLLSKKPLILSPKSFNIPQDRKRVFFLVIKEDLVKNKNDFFDYVDDIKKNIEEKDEGLDSYMDKINKKKFEKYSVGEYNTCVLSGWNEFVKGLHKKNKAKIPVIWLDWLSSDRVVDTSFPEWKKNYIRNCRAFYNNNKEFIDYWLEKYKPLENWRKRDWKLEWQAADQANSLENCFIQLRQSGIRCRRKNGFPTLVAMAQMPIIYEKRFKGWRFFTDRECANIQSFNKDFKLADNPTISYKQFGNSVNVEVAEFAIESLLAYPNENSS